MDSIRSAWRETKNIVVGYSDIQAKLRDATSVSSSGPSTGQLQELASASHHASFLGDMIYIFNKRLNDHGKYWRHVYKTLVVIEFCVIFGSEAMVSYAKDSLYTIKTLSEFIYIDEKGMDKGILVREKSKDLCELLTDDLLLAESRRTGVIPHTRRPRSTEPILVDPKQRKRIGDKERNFEDLQDVDENEALRIALSASRSDNSKYKSLELDEDIDDSDSSDDNAHSLSANIVHTNPFMIPSVDLNFFSIEADPFSANNEININNNLIEMNPFSGAMIESNNIDPSGTLAIDYGSINSNFTQIEYNVNSYDRFMMSQDEETKPFLPNPSNFTTHNFTEMTAKPVGPHMAAPQFGYNKTNPKSFETLENPFEEDQIPSIKEAQNSPYFNLQK